MRRSICFVAFCLALGLAPAASADHHAGDLMAELTAIGDSISAAMTAGDWDSMLDMYAEDAISLPNFGPRMQGVEAFREHQQQMMAAGMKIHSFESEPTEAWQAGDHVIEIGNFEIELEVPGMPGKVQDKGKYMTVYVRDDEGALKIKAETWNTDMNPMEMMGMGGDHGHEHGSEAEGGDQDADQGADEG